MHSGQTTPVERVSKVKNSSIFEIPQFFSGWMVVAMVIVINSVIGGFCSVDWVWLATDHRFPITANYPITAEQND